VIAGGSEGVGASFARLLAATGINVVLIARRPEPLAEVAAEVRALGVQVRTVELDLLDPDMLSRVRAATDDLEVGLLVFNAGANTYRHEFIAGDLARFRQVIDLNVNAQLALTHHFGATMRRRGRGGIVLVGSLAGYLGQAEIGIYSAAKAFSRVFAEALWLELRQHGVHVLELVLGVTRTPAMARAGLDLDRPGLRVAEPDDVAREGLAHLADGPVWVASGNSATAAHRSGMNRAELVLGGQDASRRLLTPQEPSILER
jgi:short-subunit dehydrogenase